MTMKGKEDEAPCFCSSTYGKAVAMDFLDEYWHFHNVLKRTQILRRPPPPPDASSPKKAVDARSSTRQGGQVTAAARVPAGDRIAARALLRTPSLPPRIEQREIAREESATSKLSNRDLRHSCSSLDDNQSFPSSKSTTPSPSSARHRRGRHIKVEGPTGCGGASNDYAMKQADFRSAFQEKKWKSSSDLECFEVKGFRDLGFVFDKEELDASLVRVIPGLRDRRPSEEEEEEDDDDDEKVRRPYLSEAWIVQRSAPPKLRWVGGGSAEDMKEQLKFWARAVACNVRQEC